MMMMFLLFILFQVGWFWGGFFFKETRKKWIVERGVGRL